MAFGPPNVQAVVLTGPGADTPRFSISPEPLIPSTPPENKALRERADIWTSPVRTFCALLGRAALMTEENSKNTLQEVHQLLRELRIAQDRIKELEAHLEPLSAPN